MKRDVFLFIVAVYVTIMVLISMMTSCSDQRKTNKDEKVKSNKTEEVVTIQKQTPGQPLVKIKVSKRYNKHGDLIRFDSVYTKRYSGSEQDTVVMDSLIANFESYYSENYTTFFKDRFEKLFFGDSMLYMDFFHKDFFTHRYSLNKDYFDKMMAELDSLKNEFYNRKKIYRKK